MTVKEEAVVSVPGHKHYDAFFSEMVLGDIDARFFRGRNHVAKHGPSLIVANLSKSNVSRLGQLEEAVGNCAHVVVGCPPESLSKCGEMLKLEPVSIFVRITYLAEMKEAYKRY